MGIHLAPFHLNRNAVPPEPRRIIVDDAEGDSTPGGGSPPLVDDSRIHSPPPIPLQQRVETRLLPQILREEMKGPPTSTPIVTKKRPLHSKPRAKHFKSNSRKGKKRIAGFVNLHLPFGYEPLPNVDLGTLDDALRKLGIDV